MPGTLDCVVVGHNGCDEMALTPREVPADPTADWPSQLRDLRRTRIDIRGRLRTYLDAFSVLRHEGSSHEPVPMYSVEELPSLTAIYLASFLRQRGLGATFVNSFTFERKRLASLLEARPRAVAIITTLYLGPRPAREVVRFVRDRAPMIPIVMGGPLVFNLCQTASAVHLWSAFERIGADYYVWESQGEWTLELLLRSLGSTRPGEVPNVYRRNGKQWTLAGRRTEANDLDGCAVDWRSFDRAELGTTVSTRTARSCAYSCSFCDYPSRAGALSLAGLDVVRDELITLASLGVKRISFVDDTFNVPVQRFRDFCAMMTELDLGIEWYCYFRCGNIRTENEYDSLVEAGCRGVFLGVESGDAGVLDAMNKKAAAEQYLFGIERLREREVFVHASFVVGFPGETHDSVSRTIEFLEVSQPDTFTASPWHYLHSTPIHGEAAKFSLRGEGRNWQHATMNSREAMSQADRIFQEVTHSVWMPVPGLDFWGVPYLIGKGFSRDDLVEMLRLGQEATPLGAAGRPDCGTSTLRDLARRIELDPARYVYREVESETGSRT